MKDPKAIICFSAQGQWTARDATSLIDSVSGIYDVLSVYYAFAFIRRDHERALHHKLRKHTRLGNSKEMEEMYFLWKNFYMDRPEHEGSNPYSTMPPPFQILGTGKQIPTRLEILDNIDLYRDIVDELKVDRILTASPGGFSFSGFGDVIKQLRILIKDLSYRNRQEKENGAIKVKLKERELAKSDLEIIETSLRTIKESYDSDLSPLTSFLVDKRLVERNLAKKILSHMENIRKLEHEEKLLSLHDNLDTRPGSKKSKSNKP